MNERKRELVELSEKIRKEYQKANPKADLKTLPPGWLNEKIRNHYQKQAGQALEFNSFMQWRQKGYKVNKGEKAFLIWGKKRKYNEKSEKKEPQKQKQEDEQSAKSWHPVAYIFSQNQVSLIDEITQQKKEKSQ